MGGGEIVRNLATGDQPLGSRARGRGLATLGRLPAAPCSPGRWTGRCLRRRRSHAAGTRGTAPHKRNRRPGYGRAARRRRRKRGDITSIRSHRTSSSSNLVNRDWTTGQKCPFLVCRGHGSLADDGMIWHRFIYIDSCVSGQ